MDDKDFEARKKEICDQYLSMVSGGSLSGEPAPMPRLSVIKKKAKRLDKACEGLESALANFAVTEVGFLCIEDPSNHDPGTFIKERRQLRSLIEKTRKRTQALLRYQFEIKHQQRGKDWESPALKIFIYEMGKLYKKKHGQLSRYNKKPDGTHYGGLLEFIKNTLIEIEHPAFSDSSIANHIDRIIFGSDT